MSTIALFIKYGLGDASDLQQSFSSNTTVKLAATQCFDRCNFICDICCIFEILVLDSFRVAKICHMQYVSRYADISPTSRVQGRGARFSSWGCEEKVQKTNFFILPHQYSVFQFSVCFNLSAIISCSHSS